MFLSNKKAQGFRKLATVVIGAILLVLILVLLYDKTLGTYKLFSFLEPSKCTDAYKGVSITEFKENIKLYAAKERQDGAQNERYYPPDAVEHFKIFISCKEEGMFDSDELAEHEAEIKNDAKSAYISLAEDICTEWCEAKKSSEEDMEDLEDKHQEHVDDYYVTFEEEDFAGPTSCPAFTCPV
jgi:hypothetical protein